MIMRGPNPAHKPVWWDNTLTFYEEIGMMKLKTQWHFWLSIEFESDFRTTGLRPLNPNVEIVCPMELPLALFMYETTESAGCETMAQNTPAMYPAAKVTTSCSPLEHSSLEEWREKRNLGMTTLRHWPEAVGSSIFMVTLLELNFSFCHEDSVNYCLTNDIDAVPWSFFNPAVLKFFKSSELSIWTWTYLGFGTTCLYSTSTVRSKHANFIMVYGICLPHKGARDL